MSACRDIFVLCNSRWRTYVVSRLRNIEVYAIQGCNKCIVNVGPRDSVLFIKVSVFQGVRISGFHCSPTCKWYVGIESLSTFNTGKNFSTKASHFIIV